MRPAAEFLYTFGIGAVSLALLVSISWVIGWPLRKRGTAVCIALGGLTLVLVPVAAFLIFKLGGVVLDLLWMGCK